MQHGSNSLWSYTGYHAQDMHQKWLVALKQSCQLLLRTAHTSRWYMHCDIFDFAGHALDHVPGAKGSQGRTQQSDADHQTQARQDHSSTRTSQKQQPDNGYRPQVYSHMLHANLLRVLNTDCLLFKAAYNCVCWMMLVPQQIWCSCCPSCLHDLVFVHHACMMWYLTNVPCLSGS